MSQRGDLMREFGYPVLIRPIADTRDYVATLPDFGNQKILISGNLFEEVRWWIKGRLSQTNIWPLPSPIWQIQCQENFNFNAKRDSS